MKVEGPNQILIFLGIELDTLRLEAHLLDDKLAELKQRLSILLQSGHTTAGSLDSFSANSPLLHMLWCLAALLHAVCGTLNATTIMQSHISN